MTPEDQKKADDAAIARANADRVRATQAQEPPVRRPVAPKDNLPLDTATTDRSPGKQGQFGDKPKTAACLYCGK